MGAQRDLWVLNEGREFTTVYEWVEADGDPIVGFPAGWTAVARLGRWLGRAAELELDGTAGANGSVIVDAVTGAITVSVHPAGMALLGRWSHVVLDLIPPPGPTPVPVPFVEGLAVKLGGLTGG